MKIEPRYTYDEVVKQFTTRAPLRRKVMHNTYVHREGEGQPIMLRYHATDIITWYPMPRGDIVVNTDGWHTPTTKLRLNEFLRPLCLYQQKGEWFWSCRGWMQDKVPFTDGDMIEYDKSTGTYSLRVCSSVEEAQDAMKEKLRLKRKVKAYANKYVQAMPFDWESRRGDCMYCQMHLARRQADGLAPVMEKQIGGKTIERTPTIGELESGAHPESVADHIMSHISEGYIMASVAYNALTHPRSQVAPAYMWAAFTGPDGQTFPDHGDYIKKRVAKVIYEYLCRQLQLTK